MPSPYDYSSGTGYARARPDWTDFPSTTTPIQQVHLDRIDQALYDLKFEKFNVRDYGADPAGSAAANVTAFQAAIDAAEAAEGEVFIPEGDYSLNAGLTVQGHHVRIRGQGPETVRLSYTGTGGIILDLGDNSTNYEFIELEGFRLYNTGTAATGVRGRLLTNLQMNRVSVTGSTNITTGLDLASITFAHMANCEIVAGTTGMTFSNSAGINVFGGSSFRLSAGGTAGVSIASTCNDINFFGTAFENWTLGYSCSGDLCRLIAPRFDGCTSEATYAAGADQNYLIAPHTSKSPTSGIVLTVPTTALRTRVDAAGGYDTVASAATVTLPLAEVVSVSGTTTITSVTASWPSRRVTLIFQGALTFTDGSNLKLAGNFVTTADDTITLVCDGTNWFETGRSVN